MASQAHGEPITGSSLTASPQIFNKKKKKNTENEKSNPSRRWRLAESHHVASSLAERSNPITQHKSKPNTLTQRTEHRGVYQKKKKKNPQYTNQNQTQ